MKEMFFKSVKFREVQHLAFSDEYITAYVSVNHVPKIYLSVNTPRDEYGFVKGNRLPFTEELWLLHQLVYIGLSCTYTGRGYIIEKLKD